MKVAFYKKCIYLSASMMILGLIVLLLGVFLLPSLIDNSVLDSTLLKEDSYKLWGEFPGKSNVTIIKNHYFYNILNLDEVLYGNKKAIANETGPYSVSEFTQFLNRNYSKDNSSVDYHYFRYFKDLEGENTTKDDLIQNINLVTLGVWYQAKNAPRNQVALKALYTIIKSFVPDLWYGYILEATKQSSLTKPLSFLDKFSYYSEEKKNKLAYDKDYGLYQNNSFFVKACLTHPSEDSKFLSDYFDIAYHEIDYLKYFFNSKQIYDYKNDTFSSLAMKQWLDLRVNNGQSVARTMNNITVPGYIEYGAFLKEIENTKSNLTLDKVKKLLAIHEEGEDDTISLLNKRNMDILFEKEENERVKFINDDLQINDLEESKYIYKYIQYISGEMAFQFSRNGTKSIAAIADFLSQGFSQIYYSMGFDLYNGLVYSELVKKYSNQSCSDILTPLLFELPIFNINKICQNENLNITDNLMTWFNGILYKDKSFKEILNNTNEFTEYDYSSLTSDNSTIVRSMVSLIEPIFSNYSLSGNYKAFNPIKLSVRQMIDSSISLYINETKSLKHWNNKYKNEPEFSLFCEKHYNKEECKIDIAELESVANYDYMFSSKWIQDRFIDYRNNLTSTFSSKVFINYMRYILLNEVLNFYAKRTVKQLLWGYEDEFLRIVKELNYYTGGDPTIETKFTLLNNMTNKPDNDNIWTIYTGINNTEKLREYKSIYGSKTENIIMREKYFDGKNITWKERNPWKKEIKLNGTDALSFKPFVKKDELLWVFLDDLYHLGGFSYYDNKLYYGKLNAYRYLLLNSTIKNSTIYPQNDVYYCDVYNGFGNFTTVYKAPLFASKPYYRHCDNSYTEQSVINNITYLNASKTTDKDDIDLYLETWVDVEPFSGAVIGASQKLLISALIEKDDLFEIDNKFIPIYYLIRSGNITENSVQELFSDLMTGICFKQIIQLIGVCVIFFFVSLAIFSFIKFKMNKIDIDSDKITPLTY